MNSHSRIPLANSLRARALVAQPCGSDYNEESDGNYVPLSYRKHFLESNSDNSNDKSASNQSYSSHTMPLPLPAVQLSASEFRRLELRKLERRVKLPKYKSATLKSLANAVAPPILPDSQYAALLNSSLIYSCVGGTSIDVLRSALNSRGWIENPFEESPHFHFQWAILSRLVPFDSLQSHQLINHIAGANSLTSKIGLARAMEFDSNWIGQQPTRFFPRCFPVHIHETSLKKEFQSQFRTFAAISILQHLDEAMQEENGTEVAQHQQQQRSIEPPVDVPLVGVQYYTASDSGGNSSVPVLLSSDPLESTQFLKRPKFLNFDSSTQSNFPDFVTFPHISLCLLAARQYLVRLQFQVGSVEGISSNAEMKEETAISEAQWIELVDIADRLREHRKSQFYSSNEKIEKNHSPEKSSISSSSLLIHLSSARSLLDSLFVHDPQYFLNGMNNTWILKPAGLSRGRGIEVVNNFSSIWNKILKGGKFIIQKYIETPLLIHRKKFDIRQWILVVSMSGHKLIYFYSRDCYFRFSSSDFNPFDSDKLIHLTNNSIQKHHKEFGLEFADGNMWNSIQFKQYLEENYGSQGGKSIWNEKIQPAMMEIARVAVDSVNESMEYRSPAFSLYGVDFMVDQHFRPWLIEVNSSPTLIDISVAGLVPSMIDDLLSVVLDQKFSPLYWMREAIEKKKREKINETKSNAVANEANSDAPLAEFFNCQPPIGTEFPFEPQIGGWRLLSNERIGFAADWKRSSADSSLIIVGRNNEAGGAKSIKKSKGKLNKS